MSNLYYIPVYDPYSYDPTRHKNYARYVDGLREQFTIRIEVRGVFTPSLNAQILADIESFLNKLEKCNYAVQTQSGYVGLHYVWFMRKEDALAFMLKFNGKVV